MNGGRACRHKKNRRQAEMSEQTDLQIEVQDISPAGIVARQGLRVELSLFKVLFASSSCRNVYGLFLNK